MISVRYTPFGNDLAVSPPAVALPWSLSARLDWGWSRLSRLRSATGCAR